MMLIVAKGLPWATHIIHNVPQGVPLYELDLVKVYGFFKTRGMSIL
jgi:hypothetical protein